MKMQFAVGMGRSEKMDEIGDHARVAEESGFSFLTLVDVQNMCRDVYAMMAVAMLSSFARRVYCLTERLKGVVRLRAHAVCRSAWL